MKRVVKVVLAVLAVLSLACCGGGIFLLTKFWDIPQANRELEPALREYQEAGLPWVASDLLQKPPVEPEENAAPLLGRAFLDLPPDPKGKDMSQASKWLRASDWKPLEKFIATYKTALAKTAVAVQRPKLEWDRDYDVYPFVERRSTRLCRRIGRSLYFRALLEANEGKSALALRDLKTLALLDNLVAQGPVFEDQSLAEALQNQLVRCCERMATVYKTNPAALTKLCAFVQSLKGVTLGPNFFRGDYYEVIALSRNWKVLGPLLNNRYDDDRPPIIDKSVLVRDGFGSNFVVLASLTRFLQGGITVTRLQRSFGTNLVGFRDALAKLEEDPSWFKTASNVLPNSLASAISMEVDIVIRFEARFRALKCLFAAIAIKGKTGSWPRSLLDIPGSWIDPYTNRPLLTKTTTDGFRVYSVGPNLKDDGGIDQLETPAKVHGKRNETYDLVESYPAVVSIR